MQHFCELATINFFIALQCLFIFSNPWKSSLSDSYFMYHWSTDMCWVWVSNGSVRMNKITAAQTPSPFTAVCYKNLTSSTLCQGLTLWVTTSFFPTTCNSPDLWANIFLVDAPFVFVYFCGIFMGVFSQGLKFVQTATPTDSSGRNLGTVHFNYSPCQMLLWERPKRVVWNIFGAGRLL